MIEQRVGDLLEQKDLTCIVHQANLYHTFGAGIAAVIRAKYPEAYAADCQTGRGDSSKLGTWSYAKTASGLYVFNLYSQAGLGGQDRNTSYDAMERGLKGLRDTIIMADSGGGNAKLGIPYRLGCGLANGSWLVVSAIIADVFDKAPLKVVICKRAEDDAPKHGYFAPHASVKS